MKPSTSYLLNSLTTHSFLQKTITMWAFLFVLVVNINAGNEIQGAKMDRSAGDDRSGFVPTISFTEYAENVEETLACDCSDPVFQANDLLPLRNDDFTFRQSDNVISSLVEIDSLEPMIPLDAHLSQADIRR